MQQAALGYSTLDIFFFGTGARSISGSQFSGSAERDSQGTQQHSTQTGFV